MSRDVVLLANVLDEEEHYVHHFDEGFHEPIEGDMIRELKSRQISREMTTLRRYFILSMEILEAFILTRI